MKTINTQVFDEFPVHNLSGFARKSTVKKYLAPQESTSNSHRPIDSGFARKSTVKKYLAPQESTSNSHRPIDRCTSELLSPSGTYVQSFKSIAPSVTKCALLTNDGRHVICIGSPQLSQKWNIDLWHSCSHYHKSVFQPVLGTVLV
jgi:hypothetical protein